MTQSQLHILCGRLFQAKSWGLESIIFNDIVYYVVDLPSHQSQIVPVNGGMGEVQKPLNTSMCLSVKKSDPTSTAVIRFMYFGFCYPHDFISKVWGEDGEWIVKHLEEKFKYFDYNFSAFFMELDDNNKRILCRWIEANYKGY